MSVDREAPVRTSTDEIGGAYARRVLLVLAVVYALSSLDRQLLSILAEDIKADLHLTDSQLGFLHGTAFGVFYALFGIPLGRLADFLSRRALLSAGLALWSGMTVASGFANSFAHLAIARVGVGIGEASASPCSYSMLSDRFPKAQRAGVLAIYASGMYVGSGLSKILGGYVLVFWNSHYQDGGPLSLHAWQVAFLIAGLPGLLLAYWVYRLREPVRGAADGIVTIEERHPWRRSFVEFSSSIPPLTLWSAAQLGKAALITNISLAGLIAGLCAILTHYSGDVLQWAALGIGCYSVVSWVQSLRGRDQPTYQLIFRSPVYLVAVLGFGLTSTVNAAIVFWLAPYAIRVLHAQVGITGLVMGLSAAGGGFLGVVAGGKIADRLLRSNPAGRLVVAMVSALGMVLPIIGMLTTSNLAWFFCLHFLYSVIGNAWVGCAAATTQDLVLPRMRGVAAATNILSFTLLGLCVGPYAIGKVSTVTGDLGLAILSSLTLIPPALACLWFVYRRLPSAERSRLARAQLAGEPGQ